MKLYSWVSNERGTVKTQGGHKRIVFTLDYEEKGQDWRDNDSEHSLILTFVLDDTGKPVLYVRGNKSYEMIDKR